MRHSTGPCVAYSFIGNLGCVRFPDRIKKATGIKRGDRLKVELVGRGAVTLTKASDAEVPALAVAGCSCATAPDGCAEEGATVAVGWSYVQFEGQVARRLGFLPGEPVQLVGEPNRVLIRLHDDANDLKGVPPVICPP